MTDTDNEMDDASPDDGEIPEVEAEIVDDDAQTSSGFDDGAEDEASVESPPRKMGTLTPGVILFLAFATIALLLFMVWRFLPSGTNDRSPTAETKEQSESLLVTPDDKALDSLGAANAATEDVAPEIPDTEELAPQQETNTAIDMGKIDNSKVAATKEKVGAFDPAPSPPGSEVFLPPLPQDQPDNAHQSDGGNLAFQQSAKEAFRQLQQENEAADETFPAPSVDGEAQSQSIESFEVNPSVTAPAADRAQEDFDHNDAQELIVDELASTQPETEEETNSASSSAKISNSDDAIKQAVRDETAQLNAALDAERKKNTALEDEIMALRRDMQAALEARDAQTSEAIAGMRVELDKIQNNNRLPAARRSVGIAALSDLMRAISEGRSYADELDVLAQHAPEAAPISVLRKYAGSGVMSAIELKKSFGAAAREGLAAAGREKAQGIFASLAARAQSLISVRPAAPQSGDSARAVISRAEAAVVEDDFALALTHLDGLPESAAAAMDNWITGARGRIETAAAIEDLNTMFLGPASN